MNGVCGTMRWDDCIYCENYPEKEGGCKLNAGVEVDEI